MRSDTSIEASVIFQCGDSLAGRIDYGFTRLQGHHAHLTGDGGSIGMGWI
jgi:hypothetical protein